MTVGKYAVSLQYGKWAHHFYWTGEDREEFVKYLAQAKIFCKAYRKRGAKPTAFGWQQSGGGL